MHSMGDAATAISVWSCLERAAECQYLAQKTYKPHWKEAFERMAHHWLIVAASRELTEVHIGTCRRKADEADR
jgi:hypothetical protein